MLHVQWIGLQASGELYTEKTALLKKVMDIITRYAVEYQYVTTDALPPPRWPKDPLKVHVMEKYKGK